MELQIQGVTGTETKQEENEKNVSVAQMFARSFIAHAMTRLKINVARTFGLLEVIVEPTFIPSDEKTANAKRDELTGEPVTKAQLVAIPRDKGAANFDPADPKQVEGFVVKVRGYTPGMFIAGLTDAIARLLHRAKGNVTGFPDRTLYSVADRITAEPEVQPTPEVLEGFQTLIRQKQDTRTRTLLSLILETTDALLPLKVSNRVTAKKDKSDLAVWIAFCEQRGLTLRDADTDKVYVQGTESFMGGIGHAGEAEGAEGTEPEDEDLDLSVSNV